MLEVIILVLVSFQISKKLKEKGYVPKPWIWKLVGAWVGFEFLGGLISFYITHDVIQASFFGIVCGFGGFLLIKYQVDKLPDITKSDWHDRLGDADHS